MKWAIEERVLNIDLYKGRNTTKKTNLLSNINEKFNVSFSTSQAMTGTMTELNLKIYGLEKSKMFYLATSATPWGNNIILNEVVLSAGYRGKQSLLFQGEIMEATPNIDTADYSIDLKAVSYFSVARNNNFSLSKEGETSVIVILQQIANNLGFAFVESLTKPYYVSNYALQNANPYEHIRELSRLTGLNIFINNSRLYVVEVGEVVKGTPELIINDKNLIGVPKPNNVGCDVSIRMTTNVISGQPVKITSFKYPQLNSNEYIVEFVSHQGETWGSSWQTNLTLVRKGLYNV